MPKFIPKSKREGKRTAPQHEKKTKPKPELTDEERAKLRELERKFGISGDSKDSKPSPKTASKEPKKTPSGSTTVWEKIDRTKKDAGKKEPRDGHGSIVEHEARRHTRIPEGMIGPGDPDYVSKDKVERRKRELAMTEARLRSLEREEQDINKRLDYLRKEHSAMEMAIKEKTHLEREIAELREDRDRVRTKLDELKEMEGKLEQQTWEELKASPAIGSKISALERRIHELEGQIIELNELRLKTAGGHPVTQPATQSVTQPTPQPPTEQKPAAQPEPQSTPQPATQQPASQPSPQPQQEKKPAPKAPGVKKRKKPRIAF
jgi:DNA repair exonuclease SbcCD ATPase subunit